MQGIGNDYVYVNCFEENIENPPELSIAISDRHFGVGSDGLIMIMPSPVADARMRILMLTAARHRCAATVSGVLLNIYTNVE